VQVEQARQSPVVLMGHSLGAQVALAFAAAYPQQVAALVLIDPVFPQALHGTLGRVARYRRLVLGLARLLRLFYRFGLRRRHYPYRDLGALDRRTRAYLAEHPHAVIADLYMNPLADLKYIPYANYLQDLYEVTRPLPDLAPVSAPALVLLSAGASTADVSATRRLLGQLSDCSIETIDADHWLLTERPEQARRVIEHWLQAKRDEGRFPEGRQAAATRDLL
jgi:pimeloyl-ACP methyl ester carboxylesterase